MKLTVLGSSGGCPGKGNAASGYLIEYGSTTVWCDAGSGTFMALMDRVDPAAIDAVVISHAHTDHCADLIAFFGYMAYGPSGEIPVPVYLPPDTIEPLAAFVRADGDHVFHMTFDFNIVNDGDTAEVGDIELRFADTNHPVPTVSVRFEAGGRSLAYSADTGPGGGYPALCVGADVMLCEATLQGERTPLTYEYHLTAAEAGALAHRADVGRLILTHVSPTLRPEESLSEAAITYGTEPELAAPGLEIYV
jgi:ribonuclease BN (tRNA processing enzyme)